MSVKGKHLCPAHCLKTAALGRMEWGEAAGGDRPQTKNVLALCSASVWALPDTAEINSFLEKHLWLY